MKNKLLAAAISGISLISIIICLICNIAINHTLSWSLIVIATIVFVWLIIIPLIIVKDSKKVICMLISLTIFIIPYLFILSLILDNWDIIKIGIVSSVISLIYLWLLYLINQRLTDKGLACTGIELVLTAIFSIVINITLSLMLSTNTFNLGSIICIIVLVIFSIICFIYHNLYVKTEKELNSKEVKKK